MIPVTMEALKIKLNQLFIEHFCSPRTTLHASTAVWLCQLKYQIYTLSISTLSGMT